MKRLHANVAAEDLEQSVRFYATLFAGYAKWMLDDPRVNFAIAARGRPPGLDHLGIQVKTEKELQEVATRLKAAERPVLDQGAVTCCYARSEKSWISDPQGIAWETFRTFGGSTVNGDDADLASVAEPSAGVCCVSAAEAASAAMLTLTKQPTSRRMRRRYGG